VREIRFRGKRVDNGEWVFGYLTVYTDGSYTITAKAERRTSRFLAVEDKDGVQKPFYEVCSTEHEVDPTTVGEWTGLTDKNKVDIYEDDILARPYGEMGVCVWDERQAGYYLKMLNGEFEGRHLPLIAENVEHHEVIAGNVHDNLELLEGSHAD